MVQLRLYLCNNPLVDTLNCRKRKWCIYSIKTRVRLRESCAFQGKEIKFSKYLLTFAPFSFFLNLVYKHYCTATKSKIDVIRNVSVTLIEDYFIEENAKEEINNTAESKNGYQ